MDLKDTVKMMTSDDHKERFKAEYYQTKERYERLKAFNTKIEAATATAMSIGNKQKIEIPEHVCPDYLLCEQQHKMGEYLHILEVRAVIEGIEL